MLTFDTWCQGMLNLGLEVGLVPDEVGTRCRDRSSRSDLWSTRSTWDVEIGARGQSCAWQGRHERSRPELEIGLVPNEVGTRCRDRNLRSDLCPTRSAREVVIEAQGRMDGALCTGLIFICLVNFSFFFPKKTSLSLQGLAWDRGYLKLKWSHQNLFF